MSDTKFEWKTLTEDDLSWTDRARVPGGWLYRETRRVMTQEGLQVVAIALCFVPDLKLRYD